MVICMTACKQTKPEGENPFLTEWETPFGVPPFDQIRAEHYLPAFERGMELHLAQIDSITTDTAAPTFENTVLAYDNSGGMLDRVNRVFTLLSQAETNAEMLVIEADIRPRLAQHSDKILMNDALFARVKTVYDNRGSIADTLKVRLVERTYRKFVRAGALLQGQDKEYLQKINGDLSKLTIRFGANLLADNNNFVLLLGRDDLEGLPEGVISAAAAAAEGKGQKGKWAFTLDKPSLIPFITSSSRRDLRETLYRGYLERCNHDDSTDNKDIIEQIVRLRLEKARMLGFDTYSAFDLDVQMARTPAAVYSLLDALWKPALASAKKELAEMKTLMAGDSLDPDHFASWDWWYYAEKVRKQRYDLDEEMLRPYFSLENVKAGIFNLANRLYGVTFRPVNVPVYHTECSAYEVLDRDLTHLAILYFDFFPRPGKRGGAWFDEYRPQTYKDGKRVAPVTSIVCNFTRPVGTQPALLSLDETETFFHEFGHALHFIFCDVPYNGLRDVERDFVELPSQIMENWAFEPEVLRSYAIHYSAGTVIPDYLINKIQNSSLFNQGFVTTELLAASLSDMDIHSRTTGDPFDVNAYEREVLNDRRGLIPEIAPRYRYPYFRHIFDGEYAAGYYSYIWSEVLDKDAYEAFVESGDIFNPVIAARFRKEVLSKGGTADGMVLYERFRGKAPSREPLLRKRGLIE